MLGASYDSFQRWFKHLQTYTYPYSFRNMKASIYVHITCMFNAYTFFSFHENITYFMHHCRICFPSLNRIYWRIFFSSNQMSSFLWKLYYFVLWMHHILFTQLVLPFPSNYIFSIINHVQHINLPCLFQDLLVALLYLLKTKSLGQWKGTN